MSFPELESVRNARELHTQAIRAYITSMTRRQDYINAMHSRVGDDELRHIHYDCVDAHNKNMHAHNEMLGIRPYQLID